MSVTTLCNLTATLYHPQIKKSTGGGQDPSAFAQDPDAVNVPCSIQPANASTVIKFAQLRMMVDVVVYFDAPWNCQNGDVWKSIDQNTGQVRTFVVRGFTNSLELNDAWVCPCYEQRVPLPAGG